MVIQALNKHGRQLLIASVLALRHSSLLLSWKNKCSTSLGFAKLHKNRLLRLLPGKTPIEPTVRRARLPVATTTTTSLIASFSLWKKKGTPAAADPKADSKMAEAAAKNLSETIQHSDQLFDENNFQEAYDLLVKSAEPESYDIKWRMARVIYNLSKSAPSPKKEELIRESFQFATDALALNDKDYASHKWYSILLDAKSGLDGIKERITQLENVKKHMLKAVELNPNDATSWYILGQFYYGLADLPWYQRKIVSTIFAAPPSGSYEEALDCFEKAEKTKPNFYSMNHLMLGKTCQALKQNDKAKEYLALAANVVVLNEDDKQAKEEAAKLLKKL
ncbi:regulator of microtubule dynamics protein 1-like [Culex pipiens pallens]|uniref:regulator of microtubule dynamics protein 1-like n=1 Tax=Culex pipiens pallens TaxID=42434 RepID=UPI0019534444|nr:regulator of microtubule dynamics protein 1-like [Culex pipiens pallens]